MKLIGIIGDPIRHSLSPIMQKAAFEAKGIRALVLPFRVPAKRLGPFMKKARRLGMVDFNVTVPHKEKIFRYLDQIDSEAKKIGAVNTVVKKGKKLVGFNTDVPGYQRSLKESGFRARGKAILVLGAGGASRAVLYALAKSGASTLYVSNRTEARAKRLNSWFRPLFRNRPLQIVPFKKSSWMKIFPKLDLLVNATTVGLNGTKFKDLPIERLNPKALVSDLNYNPCKTPLLKKARQRGLKTHSGIGMLLHQGALSFQLWTGKRPNLQVMKKALKYHFTLYPPLRIRGGNRALKNLSARWGSYKSP